MFLKTIVEEADKPQVKSGWGTGAATTTGNSNMGMNKKSNAASYWDNKTTELEIPEMEADDNQNEEVAISAPTVAQTDLVGLQELNADQAMNVPSVVSENIDISLLTCNIRPIMDLIETDMHWDYTNLQAEIGQNFRERYGTDGTSKIEGTNANNV